MIQNFHSYKRKKSFMFVQIKIILIQNNFNNSIFSGITDTPKGVF